MSVDPLPKAPRLLDALESVLLIGFGVINT